MVNCILVEIITMMIIARHGLWIVVSAYYLYIPGGMTPLIARVIAVRRRSCGDSFPIPPQFPHLATMLSAIRVKSSFENLSVR